MIMYWERIAINRTVTANYFRFRPVLFRYASYRCVSSENSGELQSSYRLIIIKQTFYRVQLSCSIEKMKSKQLNALGNNSSGHSLYVGPDAI